MKKSFITIELVKYFKALLVSDQPSDEVYESVNKDSLRAGIYISKHACGDDNKTIIRDYLETISVNPNATFYKTWEDVTSKSRFELLCDQLAHYASTYGTNFEGKSYIPNDQPAVFENIILSDYTYIYAYSEDEYYQKILKSIESGIALNSFLVNDMVDFIVEYNTLKGIKWNYRDISSIKNREAKTLIMCRLNIKPDTSGLDLFKYIYTKLTGSAMIIKDEITIHKIKVRSQSCLDIFKSLDDNDMKLLGEVFYRYKVLFIAMKNQETKSIINKIRKYAKIYHKPMNPDFWASIINTCPNYDVDEFKKRLPELNTFRLINLLNEMDRRFTGIAYNIYRIRNGKSFLRKVDKERTKSHFGLYVKLYNELIDRLKEKACKISLPDNIELVCPVSEKNFIGDIPMGSYVKLEEHNNFIGIYWRNEWGTRDYDLSAVTDSGKKIGWNSYYNENGLVYSGDMTDANPEATEILYSKSPLDDFLIYVNRFSGKPGTKFNIFFGVEDIKTLSRNYMVDPRNVKFTAEMKPDQNQSVIGRVCGDKFYFTNMTLGNKIVSVDEEGANEAMTSKISKMLNLKDVLEDAGFEFVDDGADIDLKTLNKSKLIELFS